MKLFITSLTGLLLITAAGVTSADNLTVIDNGMDGDTRYHTIVCPDGNRSTVTMQYLFTDGREPELKQVCIFTHKSNQCLPKWDLDVAAKASCE